MNDIFAQGAYWAVALSLATYFLGMFLQKKTGLAIVNPMVIAIVATIAFLLVTHVEYETYENAASILNWLITPTTVCLAIPLYEEINVLKKNWKAIIAGILSGVMINLTTILILSKVFGLDHASYVTLLPKSVTTAIGMNLSSELGGLVTITIVAIIITGVFGNMFAELILKLFRVNNSVSKGIGIGTSAHALGTAKAFEIGEIEGAMSSLSVAVAGIMSAIIIPIYSSIM